MNKSILSLFSLVISSFSALAGGGATWSPSVSAGQCVEFSSGGSTGGYKWKDLSSCNDVINHGYALGVQVSGKVVYEGGQDSIGYFGIVKQGGNYIVQAPETLNGNKKKGFADTYTQWLQ